jgi:DNA-3-methyladenine glycosylase II
MKQIVRKISKVDPAFIPIIKASPLCNIGVIDVPEDSQAKPRKKYARTHYQTLVTSILSQQVSVKAADSIIKKVSVLNGGRITPEKMAKLSPAKLRTAGVSGAKAKAIGELTDAVLNRDISFHKFPSMSNEDISLGLTNIWGIGRWTVEMFLMFHLGRLDVWPVGDLAMRRGWEKLHGLKEEIHPKELDKVSEKFAGHQSVVAWYCWRATEGDSSSW